MKVTGKSNFQNPDPGTVSAVCTKIIDMGTQVTKFGAKRTVAIYWEVSQVMADGRPFQVRKEYAASVHPMSNLGKDLKSWFARDLNDDELAGMDLSILLGKACILSLVQNGDYTNVGTVSALIQGMQPLVPQGALVYFDLDKFDQAVFDQFSDNLRNKIKETEEYKAIPVNADILS